MSETIICVALKTESRERFEKVLSKKKNKENIHMVYTNVGKVNAAYWLTKTIYELKSKNKNISNIINIGTAGGVNVSSESIVYCNQFIQADFDHTILGFQLGINNSYCENNNIKNSEFCSLALEFEKKIKHKKYRTCFSIDQFSDQLIKINNITSYVVEMEAYALALVCKYEKIQNFIAVKYVSDEIGKKTQAKDFERLLEMASIKLSKELSTILDKVTN